MRKLYTFDRFEEAERLAAYLASRQTPTEVRHETGGRFGIWVLDDDRLEFARETLRVYEVDPLADQFRVASAAATPAASNLPPSRSRTPAVWHRLPVTMTLISASVVATVITLYGEPLGLGDFGERARPALSIAHYDVEGRHIRFWPGLVEIRAGEIWRLVTPIFPHGNLLHLLFNMAWMWLLGGAIETMRSSLRLGLLVLATAIVSNVAEFYFDFGFSYDRQQGLVNLSGFDPNPLFLGMSGVVFGLFGYIWMQARLLPKSGFAMPGDMVVWMMIWLVICTTGLVGPIANVAHGAGLISGMLLGALPRLWKR